MGMITRLLTSTCVAIGSGAVIGLGACLNLHSVERDFDGLVRRSEPVVETLSNACHAALRIATAATDVVLIKAVSYAENPEDRIQGDLQQIASARITFDTALDSYAARSGAGENEGRLRSTAERLADASEAIRALSVSGASDVDLLTARNEISEATESAIGAISDRIREERTALGARAHDLRETLWTTLRIILLAGLCTLVASAITTFAVERSIARPLRGLAQAARRATAGDIGFDVEKSGQGGEVEDVRIAFGTVLESLRRHRAEQERVHDELREATRIAESARADAELASGAKSRFLAMMSHELRTPLHAILGYTDLILDGKDLPDETRRKLRLVRSAGSMLLTIISDVLDFSQIEAAAIELREAPYEPRLIANEVLATVSESGERKGLVLDLRCDEAVPPVCMGDADRIRQVLLNLAANAVKFTASGNVSIAIERRPAGRLLFSVSDTGIGIAQPDFKRLFRRFSQLDDSLSRQFEGSGLGLAISKGLVEMMGGEIGVSSRLGEGSTFWFTIPCDWPHPLPHRTAHPGLLRSGRGRNCAAKARARAGDGSDLLEVGSTTVMELTGSNRPSTAVTSALPKTSAG